MNTKKPPLEKKVVNQTLALIKSRGGFAVKIHGSPFQLAGLPDIIACYRGHFLAFECKRSANEKPSKIQLYVLGRITAAGGTATVIHSVEQSAAVLDRIEGLEEATKPPDHI